MTDFIKQVAAFNNNNDCFLLNDGNKIPCIGFGTWKIKDSENGADIVSEAIKAGFRHFDTAARYKSEGSVGEAIKKSGISRDQFFVTTKVWKDDITPKAARTSLEGSLRDLQSNYVDLLLIHWPKASRHDNNWQEKVAQTWQEFIKFKQEGLVKSIGVANFLPHHLKALQSDVLPCLDQIEFHVGYLQPEIYQYCQEHNILVEGWRPLGQGALLNSPTVLKLAQKYNKQVAQILLRFCLDLGVLPIPKTTNYDRMLCNKDVFDFKLSSDDIKILKDMPLCGWSGEHPDDHIPGDD